LAFFNEGRAKSATRISYGIFIYFFPFLSFFPFAFQRLFLEIDLADSPMGGSRLLRTWVICRLPGVGGAEKPADRQVLHGASKLHIQRGEQKKKKPQNQEENRKFLPIMAS